MVRFTHLHTHSPEGSLLDGFMRIDKAIEKSKSLGMDALGISDHGTMAAHQKFYQACKANDIHPVLGCCLPGQIIYTKEGPVPIEDISPGDMVLTHKGRYRKVLRHWSREYEGKIYGMEQLNNKTVWLTDEHPVLVRQFTQGTPYHNSTSEMKWVRADSINADNRRVTITEDRDFRGQNNRGKSRRFMHEYYSVFPKNQFKENYIQIDLEDYVDKSIWKKENGVITKHSKRNKWDNLIQYKEIPSTVLLDENLAKLLGYFAAEGSFYKNQHGLTGINFTFHKKEKEYHDEVSFLFKKIFGLDSSQYLRESHSTVDISCNSVPLCGLFYHLIGSGARNKKIPNEILTSPLNVQQAFLEGLQNGDGKITDRNVVLKFANKKLTYSLKQLLANLGYGVQVCYTSSPYNGKRFDHYYVTYTPDKNRSRYTYEDDEYVYFPLKKVESKDYEGLVYNFEVEEDNSYVTDIILHNCEAYITPDRANQSKSDFEDIDYQMTDDGQYKMALLTEEEASERDGSLSWIPMESLSPKKFYNKVDREAKKPGGFLHSLVADSLPEGNNKKATVTRYVNAYLKELEKGEGKKVYLQADQEKKEFFSWFPRIGHLLLIPLNNDGYKNLIQLNNIGQTKGFYGKPRIDYNDIKEYGEGIACTSACLGSIPNQLIMQDRYEEALEELRRYDDAFEEFYLEIQPSRQPDQHKVNDVLMQWSKEYGWPLIATTDAHMVDKEEEDLHATLTNIGKGGSADTSDLDNDISVYDSAYLMTPEEILSFGIPEEALQNAYDLSHKSQVDFLDDTSTKFPEYEVPPGYTFDSYLRKLAEEGLFELFLDKEYITDYQEYQDRLDYELSIIKDKGLSAYFVIVWDYINFARSKDIYVGPGRGKNCCPLLP